MSRALTLVLFLTLAACDTGGPVTVANPAVAPVTEDLPTIDPADVATVEAYEARRAALDAEIRAAIDLRASGPEACWLLPLGRKACGGPVQYRVYGASTPSAPEVLRLARELYALDVAAQEALGLASTCDIAPVPEVRYADGQCSALSPDGAPVVD
ncbi:hypothetical protein [Rubrivirga sp. IMCC43871]|uniref:hypothetical protein n=1 Tax=Rubrivirga sp. IMCC43871 TaxID=3391575 RepID=UPI00398FD4FD